MNICKVPGDTGYIPKARNFFFKGSQKIFFKRVSKLVADHRADLEKKQYTVTVLQKEEHLQQILVNF